jgi:L-threonylcarbamoyladenylate synthase
MTRTELIKEGVENLRAGRVILCPSDTIASLSCDAGNVEAIKRIFSIKQRPSDKSLIVLVSSFTMLEGLVEHIPEAAYQWMEITDSPLTIVYSKVRNLPIDALSEDDTLAIRLVSGGFIKELIDRYRRPIVSTSANLSGKPAPVKVSEADPLISRAVDYVIDLPEFLAKPSSVVKFNSDGSFKIIRK